MILILGGKTNILERQWYDYWFHEESVLDWIERSVVETCNSCDGQNGTHQPECVVGVDEDAQRHLAAEAVIKRILPKRPPPEDELLGWADDYEKVGRRDVAKHMQLVSARIKKLRKA